MDNTYLDHSGCWNPVLKYWNRRKAKPAAKHNDATNSMDGIVAWLRMGSVMAWVAWVAWLRMDGVMAWLACVAWLGMSGVLAWVAWWHGCALVVWLYGAWLHIRGVMASVAWVAWLAWFSVFHIIGMSLEWVQNIEIVRYIGYYYSEMRHACKQVCVNTELRSQLQLYGFEFMITLYLAISSSIKSQTCHNV